MVTIVFQLPPIIVSCATAFGRRVGSLDKFDVVATRESLPGATHIEDQPTSDLKLSGPFQIRCGTCSNFRQIGASQVFVSGRLLAEMDAALADVTNSRETVRGTLRLNVPGAVTRDILPPIIEAYLARYPEVQVDVSVDDRFVDVTALGFDAGVRYGEHLALDVIAVPIGPRLQELAFAASPEYMSARGAPLHPKDLLAHDCVRLEFSSGAMIPWELQKGDEALTVDPAARLIVGVNVVESAINFARSGGGIIATFRNWLEADFERGTLVPVLPEWRKSFEGPQLYF